MQYTLLKFQICKYFQYRLHDRLCENWALRKIYSSDYEVNFIAIFVLKYFNEDLRI